MAEPSDAVVWEPRYSYSMWSTVDIQFSCWFTSNSCRWLRDTVVTSSAGQRSGCSLQCSDWSCPWPCPCQCMYWLSLSFLECL